MRWLERLGLTVGVVIGASIATGLIIAVALIHHWAIAGNTSGF